MLSQSLCRRHALSKGPFDDLGSLVSGDTSKCFEIIDTSLHSWCLKNYIHHRRPTREIYDEKAEE
jgi:hypothetical protein